MYCTKYFFQKVLPILKSIIIHLREDAKCFKLSTSILTELDDHFVKSKQNYKIFNTIYTTIYNFINGDEEQQALYSQEMADKLKSM